MKKNQLHRILHEETQPSTAWRIQQRLNEIDFFDETQEGQLVGTEEADARFSAQVQVEKDVKSAIIAAVQSGLDVEAAVSAVLRAADEYKGY